jgi:sec-independent protein translocase protein TatB
MFDVGFAEVLLLSLIALLVLGPERLPRIARTLGGLSRKARSSWLSLKRSIDEEIRQQDLKQPVDKFREDFQSTVKDFKSSVDEVKASANKIRDTATGKPRAPEKPAKPETDPPKANAPGTDGE